MLKKNKAIKKAAEHKKIFSHKTIISGNYFGDLKYRHFKNVHF